MGHQRHFYRALSTSVLRYLFMLNDRNITASFERRRPLCGGCWSAATEGLAASLSTRRSRRLSCDRPVLETFHRTCTPAFRCIFRSELWPLSQKIGAARPDEGAPISTQHFHAPGEIIQVHRGSRLTALKFSNIMLRLADSGNRITLRRRVIHRNVRKLCGHPSRYFDILDKA